MDKIGRFDRRHRGSFAKVLVTALPLSASAVEVLERTLEALVADLGGDVDVVSVQLKRKSAASNWHSPISVNASISPKSGR